MYQFLFGIIIFLGGFSYYIWNENVILQQNNLKLEGAIAEQQEAIESLEKDFS